MSATKTETGYRYGRVKTRAGNITVDALVRQDIAHGGEDGGYCELYLTTAGSPCRWVGLSESLKDDVRWDD
jgi:hypothetical protein